MENTQNQNTQESSEVKDAKEFAQMFTELKPEDKYKVQGIMIGLKMRDQIKEATA